jgi:polyisoprenoid-binding protein YceI
MKKVLILILFVSLTNSTFAQNWKPVTAGVNFKMKMLGTTVNGNFKGFSGILKFDPNDLSNSSLIGTVETNTVDTDNNLRNRHIREKEDFFNVAKYPKLKMKTTKIEKDGNNYVGYFDLTMKETTKNVKIPFIFKQEGDKATFQGSTVINRRDWAVGGGTFGMGDNVTFTITVNAVKE